MKKILTHILDFLDVEKRQKVKDDEFLAEATSLVDLERRLQILENRYTHRSHRNVFNDIQHF
jgi:hypothetical protein